MRGLAELGHRVPEAMSVIGYDDLAGVDAAQPPLTTVHQPFQEVGEAVIKKLLDTWDETEPVFIPPTLVVRGSTR